MSREIAYPSETYQERIRELYWNFVTIYFQGVFKEDPERYCKGVTTLFEETVRESGLNPEDVYPCSNHRSLFVTTKGDVLEHDGRRVNFSTNRQGYLYFRTGADSFEHPNTCLVHRLIAETFIPNPEELPIVHHIDGNKQNNDVSNLEWISCKENARYRHKKENQK